MALIKNHSPLILVTTIPHIIQDKRKLFILI
jgi:hypothetical protein